MSLDTLAYKFNVNPQNTRTLPQAQPRKTSRQTHRPRATKLPHSVHEDEERTHPTNLSQAHKITKNLNLNEGPERNPAKAQRMEIPAKGWLEK